MNQPKVGDKVLITSFGEMEAYSLPTYDSGIGQQGTIVSLPHDTEHMYAVDIIHPDDGERRPNYPELFIRDEFEVLDK